jgi:quercetin dioxygenase-like cupin family protein
MGIRRSIGKNKKSNRPTAPATVKREGVLRRASRSHVRPGPSRTGAVKVPARIRESPAKAWKARLDRPVAVPLLHLRLAGQLDRLRQESTWRTSGRNAITLTKEPTLRLVLLLLGKGTTMPEHQTPGPLTLQVLSGLVAFRAGDSAKEVGPGELIVLESAIGHEIEALEESAVLLTLASA